MFNLARILPCRNQFIDVPELQTSSSDQGGVVHGCDDGAALRDRGRCAVPHQRDASRRRSASPPGAASRVGTEHQGHTVGGGLRAPHRVRRGERHRSGSRRLPVPRIQARPVGNRATVRLGLAPRGSQGATRGATGLGCVGPGRLLGGRLCANPAVRRRERPRLPAPELHQCKRIQPRLVGRNTASEPRQGTAKRRATETAAHAARLGMDAAIRSEWMNTDRSTTQHW